MDIRMKQLAGVAVWVVLCVGMCRAAARELTFIVASDLHYYGTKANIRIQAHIDRINALPGTAYPQRRAVWWVRSPVLS